MKPQEYWGNPKFAKEWVRNRKHYSKNEARAEDKEILSQNFLPKEFKKVAEDITSVLEVGAGDGRLIGGFAKQYPDKRCASVDINPELSKYVAKKHGIETFVGDVTVKLPFKDNEFDFTYTFQVLQHIALTEEIRDALKELKRITKKELWLIEGWDNLKKWKCPNGHKRHDAGGGTFYWDIGELVDCYDTELLSKDKSRDTNNKLYKVKL